jgi:hypothetical protein
MAARAALLVVGTGLALTACTPAPPPQQITPPIASVAPAPPPALPQRKPTPPVVASLPPAQPQPEAGSFDRLHGLDETEALALLGEPKERAEAPPAILWRYASRDCDLDLYFYLDLQSRETRVLHYEVRDHDDRAERTYQRCYRELVTERHADQVGSTDRPR